MTYFVSTNRIHPNVHHFTLLVDTKGGNVYKVLILKQGDNL